MRWGVIGSAMKPLVRFFKRNHYYKHINRLIDDEDEDEDEKGRFWMTEKSGGVR